MKNIKVKHGKVSAGINREWACKFKTEAEFIEGMKGSLVDIPGPKRTEILKEEFGKLQPAKTETKVKG